jgi:hypothetical protein
MSRDAGFERKTQQWLHSYKSTVWLYVKDVAIAKR